MSVIEQAAKRLQDLRSTSFRERRGASDRSREIASSGLGNREPSNLAANAESGKGRASSREAAKGVTIGLSRLKDLGLVSPDDPKSTISEEFRVIKRPLIRNAAGKGASAIANGNLIMVTSALAGEGKTSSSLSLAMSIAMEVDKTVLLVDADVARPSVLRTLGVEEQRGLLDVLVDDSVELSEVLLRTNIERLVVLGSGTPNPRATELLASDAMAKLVREMAERYPDRIIVFDSPPLLLTNEASALAAHMGQIVVVVEAEKTGHESLKQALTLIETCPVKLLLLNKNRHGVRGGYYGTYGGSSYGQTESDR